MNAVGVAAALLQAPIADSFLGLGAGAGARCVPGQNTSSDHYLSPALGLRIRRPKVWARTCEIRGGHGQAAGEDSAAQRRRGDDRCAEAFIGNNVFCIGVIGVGRYAPRKFVSLARPGQ